MVSAFVLGLNNIQSGLLLEPLGHGVSLFNLPSDALIFYNELLQLSLCVLLLYLKFYLNLL